MSSRSYILSIPTHQLIITDHPDVFVLDESSGYGIKQVRELTAWIQQKAFTRSHKIAFITNADNLTLEAQNALLKTIEEPPAHSIVILHTKDPSHLLPTVLSRCEHISFADFINIKRSHSDDDFNWTLYVDLQENSESGIAIPTIKTVREALQTSEQFSNKYKRTELLKILDEWLLNTNFSDEHNSSNILEQILNAKELLSRNVTTQLTLDNFFISIISQD